MRGMLAITWPEAIVYGCGILAGALVFVTVLRKLG
jgi:hypothetical protein